MTRPEAREGGDAGLTGKVVASLAAAADPRLREVLEGVVRHLHTLVRELELSQEEWAKAIDFLTRTGQMCVGSRQEFILLSDVLGVSMLVDALANADPALAGERPATESTVLGPFYSEKRRWLAPGASILLRPEPGEPLSVSGRLAGLDGSPLEGAVIEVWQTAPNGLYDLQDADQPDGHLRAVFTSDPDGRFAFETILPVSYAIPTDGPVGALLRDLGRSPMRPAHIHFRISAAGYRTLVTHLFLAGDAYLARDAVFGVKPSLVVTSFRDGDRLRLVHDFSLAPTSPGS